MFQVGNVEQQAFRLVAFFEPHARAESLACLGQSLQRLAVGRSVVRLDNDIGHERLRLGHRHASTNPLLYGPRAASGHTTAARIARFQNERTLIKLGPIANAPLNRPVWQPQAKDARHS